MAGSNSAATGGEVRLEVEASDDALQAVDLGAPADGGKDKDRDDDAEGGGLDQGTKRAKDEDEERADRGGDEDDEGFSPEKMQKLRDAKTAARRGERRALNRNEKLERQMTHLFVEVEGLKTLATHGIQSGAEQTKKDAQTRYQEAFNRRTKAFDDGKSDEWNRADNDIKQAERDFAAATAAAESAAKSVTTGRTAVLQDWLGENDWFNPDGNDADTEFARDMSRKVAKDGFASNSQAHFDELDRRLRKQRPALFGKSARVEDDEPEEEREPRQRQRQEGDRGPRGVQGGRRDHEAGGIDYNTNTKVPKGLLMNYQAAGFDINDPKVKERITSRYNEVMAGRQGGLVNVG